MSEKYIKVRTDDGAVHLASPRQHWRALCQVNDPAWAPTWRVKDWMIAGSPVCETCEKIAATSIFDLWERIQNHPDFVGGQLLTIQDVTWYLYGGDDGDDVNDVDWAQAAADVTHTQLEQARNVAVSYFSRDYGFGDALQDDGMARLPEVVE